MPDGHTTSGYARKATPVERLFSWSPFSIVAVVARIKGTVSEKMLRRAVSQVRMRHPNLRVRLEADSDYNLWFTSDGAQDIEIAVVPRDSDVHWARVVQDVGQIPFEFDVRPAIRFILVQSDTVSELIILCHHILCDGLSLAYLFRDLMAHLGDPSREVELLPDPVPIVRENIPGAAKLNAMARFFIGRINSKWQEEKVVFDQRDYRALANAYWANHRHQLACIELSESQTVALVNRCRREGVTVNSALCAAFAGAQAKVQDRAPYHQSLGVGVSLRDRLLEPAGEVMGFYAGVAMLRYRYAGRAGFWQNARRFHKRVRPRYASGKLFADHLTWLQLDPTILEAINFKKLGGLVPETSTRHEKLSAFAAREDVVLSILGRDKLESLDKVIMGTAVTNLTRLDFPTKIGQLELDRLIIKPGGAFPLANVGLLLGAVTCAGKLSLVVEYAEERVDTEIMAEIRETAMRYLLEEGAS